MKKQGISLIVLIITCVVIIILGTAIIVNIARTNIIENANEAVVKQDFKTFQDELNLYIADEFAKKQGSFNVETLNETVTSKIAGIIPSIAGTKYAEYVTIENGKIAISDTMPEPEKTWAMEALGLITTSNNVPTEPEFEDTPIALVNTIVENENATMTGANFAYNNPVIPVGFKAIETDDATWLDTNKDGCPDGWNDGLVIQDNDLNEFVWVPVDGVNITYTKKFEEYPKYYDITYVDDDVNALPMKDSSIKITENEQITNYGGFYIGRYEAGVASETNPGVPVVKRGVAVWTGITYNDANPKSKTLYENSTSVRSGIVTGTQWDVVCSWIESEKDSDGNTIHDVTASTAWGNNKNTNGVAQFDKDGTTKISGTKQVAGYSEYWKAKNIYDFSGNTWEWTGELQGLRGINRGSACAYSSSAAYRNYTARYDSTAYLSFRIVLYVL